MPASLHAQPVNKPLFRKACARRLAQAQSRLGQGAGGWRGRGIEILEPSPHDRRDIQGEPMSYRKLIAVCLLVVLAPVPAAAQDNPIVARIEAFRAAYNAKDAQGIAGFYTERGALLPPQSKALVGRGPIATHYASAFGQGVGALEVRILEIDQVGPSAAVEIGETSVKAGGRTVHGRYLHVWKKVGEDWMLDRDIYHVLGVSK
ncbi:MAG: DUF4440 domain-containing protein [Nitratireductor sp.]